MGHRPNDQTGSDPHNRTGTDPTIGRAPPHNRARSDEHKASTEHPLPVFLRCWPLLEASLCVEVRRAPFTEWRVSHRLSSPAPQGRRPQKTTRAPTQHTVFEATTSAADVCTVLLRRTFELQRETTRQPQETSTDLSANRLRGQQASGLSGIRAMCYQCHGHERQRASVPQAFVPSGLQAISTVSGAEPGKASRRSRQNQPFQNYKAQPASELDSH